MVKENIDTKDIIYMIEMLPEEDRLRVKEFIRALYLAWDPDYTKVTEAERKELEEIDASIEKGEIYDESAIDW